jgi:hypothetical protein
MTLMILMVASIVQARSAQDSKVKYSCVVKPSSQIDILDLKLQGYDSKKRILSVYTENCVYSDLSEGVADGCYLRKSSDRPILIEISKSGTAEIMTHPMKRAIEARCMKVN